ncbi:MAG: hypothetical protein CM1200mP9_03210 [Gammaproteobacteria bacterium]|nr:MAG: hypothetical protein CM1200mP9_03210 [Gammaproteobacteria bacterium]
MSVAVKFCGITTMRDALGAVAAGCSAIGLNFYRIVGGAFRLLLLKRSLDVLVAR